MVVVRLVLLGWVTLVGVRGAAWAQTDTLRTSSGLRYVVLQEGEGRLAAKGDKVKVHYIGKRLNGKIFETSLADGPPVKFTVGEGDVIKGWEEIILYMREGMHVLVVVPPAFAYGAQGMADPYGDTDYLIGPSETVLFQLELVKIK
jgi:peptidyl-prolyl cis-trans isomerase A (cyclophilin A)